MELVEKKKIRSICIDTLTAIQNNQWMEDSRKPGHDAWMDYGQNIYRFMHDLQELGFENILILGEPGTGKSSGMRTLEHDTNIWYNTDEKNPVWIGGREEYGRKNAPRAPYHIVPKTYVEIINHINIGMANGMFESDRFAFVLGHTEVYKKGNDNMERLKTLGKVATKMQIEGKLETVLYSRVEMEGGKPAFILETQNNGFNTARSHQGMFEGKIENDYGLIINKLVGNN
jgi:hypothetical protein